MAVDMPAAEVDISPELVSALLRDQRPDLADLEIIELAHGWDNVSMRVGNDLVARIPRRRMAVALVRNEARWLPHLGPMLPVAIPVPLFVGAPGHGYPWPWTLVPWIPGERVADVDGLDLDRFARDLAAFLRALHVAAPDDAPVNPYRGVPLADRDEPTRERVAQLEDLIDASATLSLWGELSATSGFNGRPVWLHGDLHPANLLTVRGRLSGVIDFGDVTSGDPATDLAVAWMMFPPVTRSTFVEAYGGVDEPTWERAWGWALSLATAYLAHSADNPTMGAIGRATLRRVLTER